MQAGPQNPLCEKTHATKYRGEGESFREAAGRWASALCDDENHFKTIRDIFLDMRFMPAGRIQASVGSTKVVTAFNCFVSGTIDDSFTEGSGSIMARATEAAETMRRSGGIGYDFSPLRPKGAPIRKLQSSSTGPVSFMRIYDAICRCVSSSGHRRGAQMGVLRVDHPDIEEFVRAKQNTTELTGFNISVAVTDEFMQAVEKGSKFKLRFGGQVYREIDARALWETIMRSTWDWAEPGVLFIDRINEMNNLAYCERISATNPCGEQPLPPFGACLLGSFNLTRYVRQENTDHQPSLYFDFDQLRADIPHVVRAMDNVIDRTIYPLREQEIEAQAKRRMGLGVTGAANAIEAVLGRPCYGDPEFVEMLEDILREIAVGCYRASAHLAIEKGAFPLFDREKFCSSGFIRTLPMDVQDLVADCGVRNSHLLSIAPTGTISFCADNVSSGIEPVFSYEQERDILTPDGKQTVVVRDYGVDRLMIRGRRSADVTVEQHLAVLAAATRWVDSAVSKTCNVPPDLHWNDFKEVYMQAWRRGCKGITTFNSGGKRFGVLREVSDASCKIDPETGRRDCE